jgi:hypothetical protein
VDDQSGPEPVAALRAALEVERTGCQAAVGPGDHVHRPGVDGPAHVLAGRPDGQVVAEAAALGHVASGQGGPEAVAGLSLPGHAAGPLAVDEDPAAA